MTISFVNYDIPTKVVYDITVPRPAGTSPHDIIVLLGTLTFDADPLPPGWALIPGAPGIPMTGSVISGIYRIATSSDPSEWAYSGELFIYPSIVMSFTGVDLLSPVDAWDSNADSSAAFPPPGDPTLPGTATFPSVTVSDGTMLVGHLLDQSSTSWTDPGGTTNLFDDAGTHQTAWSKTVTAGATGSFSESPTHGTWETSVFVLRPTSSVYLVDDAAPAVLVTSGTATPPAPVGYEAEVEADSPIGYWPLNEESGTTIVGINGADGTYTSAAVPTDGPYGRTGQAFGGSRMGNINLLSNDAPVSIEVWARWTNDSGGLSMAALRPSTVFALAGFTVAGSVDSYRGGGFGPTSTADVWNDGAWHHVVVTVASGGATMDLYVDGVHQGAAATGATSAGTLLCVGHNNSSQLWDGDLALLAVYNSELSGARVLAHYEALLSLDAWPAQVVVTPGSVVLSPLVYAASVLVEAGEAVFVTGTTVLDLTMLDIDVVLGHLTSPYPSGFEAVIPFFQPEPYEQEEPGTASVDPPLPGWLLPAPGLPYRGQS